MGKVKTFLESLVEPTEEEKKKKKKAEDGQTKSPWEGKAGSYFESGKDKKKRLDEAFK